MPPSSAHPRFGIVTALPKEFAAVRAMLESPIADVPPGDPNPYLKGTISGPNGAHVVVLTLLPQMGNNSAGIACTHLLRSYPTIEDVLMVGIAGGIPQPEDPEKDVRLGDIVVSDKSGIVQYDNLKLSPGQIEVRDTSPPPSALLSANVRLLEAGRIAGNYPWESNLALAAGLENAARPSEATDRIFASDDPTHELKHPNDLYRIVRPGQPKIHYGRVGSANTLMKDPERRDFIARQYGVRAIEMEASGIADATWSFGRSYLVIRGICDYGDTHKNDLWQGYAAVAAASYLRALLQIIPAYDVSQQTAVTIEQHKKIYDSIERLRTLSSITASDAGVVDLSFGRNGDELRLEQDLYVQRDVESEILEHLSIGTQTESSKITLIVGDAGCGKTSVLWHLSQTLPRSIYEPWFLRASLLSRRFRTLHASTDLTFDRSQFYLALDGVLAEKRKPILLLDTADLLLHEEDDRDFVLEFLTTISDRGCLGVISCRYQEAKLLRPVEMNSVVIGRYSHSELLDAVEKHVRRFYRNALVDESSEHLQEIEDAVARGLPLKEVCSSPLMLRMLFLIYAPEKIPQEIHAFRLYEEYWNSRVKSDLRAGSPLHASENLERPCCVVALTMLSEGSPEIEESVARNAAEQKQVTPREIESLISRGVLRRSESGTLSFFHQTFFEHSAARGLIRFFGQRGIGMLAARMAEGWSDLFCAPVYEQALLLSEEMPGTIREEASKSLSILLGQESIVAKTSGIYVYCHARKVSQQAEHQMATLLASSPNPVVDHFLQLAPNLPQYRFQMLFSELDVIWGRRNWAEQQYTLILLERLAFREPKSVRSFLEDHQVLQFVLQTNSNNVAERKLARVLAVLARKFPEWTLEQFISLFNGILRRTSGMDAPAKILGVIADCSNVLGVRNLASRIDANMPPWHGERVRDFEQLTLAYGHLWFLEWTAQQTPVEDVVREIKGTTDTLRFAAKLEGLARLLLEREDSDGEPLLIAAQEEVTEARREMWISILLKRLMLGAPPGDAIPDHPISAYVRKRISSILIGKATQDIDFVRRIRRMLHLAVLPPNIFGGMFNNALPTHPEIWINLDGLGELLPEAYTIGFPAALQALEMAKQHPTENQKLLALTRTRLGLYANKTDGIAQQYLALTFLTEQVTGIGDVLPRIAEAFPQVLQDSAADFRSLLAKLLGSSLGRIRRAGFGLWQQMLQFGLIEPPLVRDLCDLFDREEDEMGQSTLVLLMGIAASKTIQELRPLIDKLGPLTASGEVNVRVNASTSLVSAILRSHGDAVRYGVEVLDYVLQPPTDARLAGNLGYVLDQIRESDPVAGLAFFERMLYSEGIQQLGTQSKRTLGYRLRSPARALAAVLDKSSRHRLISLVPHMDPLLGAIIVDAVSHEHFAANVALLDELASNPHVSPHVKDLIRRVKYLRERTVGGRTWPELFSELTRIHSTAGGPPSQL
jgi:nucleoside phosphorylase/energy-coupling factor transporter ATP-binding protein EcfA2